MNLSANDANNIEVRLVNEPVSGTSTEAASATAAAAENAMIEVNLNPIPVVSNTGNGADFPPLAELPSYNEALRLKKLEAATSDLPPSYFPPGCVDTRIPLDSNAGQSSLADLADLQAYDQDVGSECMFLSAFMIAFFFNWVGFFASICLLPNAAGKYGALSGFGLSMAKWVTIVRVRNTCSQESCFLSTCLLSLFFSYFLSIKNGC